MKKIFAWASALVAVMLLTGAIPMIGIVKAAIPVPHNLWGHPYDETSVQMPVGELITSWIDGVEYGRNDTFMAMAEVWFDVDTAGNWVTAPLDPNTPWVKEGGDLDEPVMYAWGDMTNIKTDPDGDTVLNSGVFVESELWNTTVVTLLDINLAIVQPTHFPKISQIIPEPDDGYPDYVFIYTEDPAFLMNDYYLQKNDGVLNGPVQTLTGISNTAGYFYANLTAIDLNGCGDELKLVWTNTGPAFGGRDIVVDRVEWNATVGGCHFTEPDNTIATDATAPATNESIHRTGILLADDTNDNAVDFVTDTPWPRPIIGAPVLAWDVPAGGEDWTGGMDHIIQLTAYDDFAINTQLLFWINYSLLSGIPGTWFPAITDQDPQPFAGWGDSVTPMAFNWSVPCANTTVAMLNADAINPNGKKGLLNSTTFEIDCQAPTVSATDPIDTATDVPINQVPRITFSEPMNTGSVVYSISPFIATTDVWQPSNDILDINHATDFTPGTVYWINITAACDDSVTGNCMAGEYDFSFTTYMVTPPTITVDNPVGGEIWSGLSDHDILFTPAHGPGLAMTFIWLNYSCLVASGTIAFGDGAALTSPIIWTVPAIDDVDCTIDAKIRDTDDMLEDISSSGLFEIDSTDPTVLSNDPLDAQIDVVVDTTVVVTFSEEMDTASVVFTLVDGGAVSGTEAWSLGNTTLTFTPDNPLAGDTVYTATVTAAAKDISDPGNTLGADHVFSFTTETTNTAPTIDLTNPTTATVWLGGGSGVIDWTMSDVETEEANLTVDVSYIYNSNTTAITTTSLAGLLTYTWNPVACPAGASIDATIQIFLEVTDEGGLSGNSTSATFSIDCTPTGTVAHSGDLETGKTLSFSITGASHTIVTYAWDFGDGTTGTGATPTHSYEEAGTYQVACTITDGEGNSGAATLATLTISEPPPVDKGFLEEYWWIILIIAVVAIIVIIALAKRKKPEEEEEEAPAEEEEEEYEEEEPEEELVEEEEEEVVEEEPIVEEEAAPAEPEPAPEAPEPAPEAAPAAAAVPAAEQAAPAEEAPAGETKECPSCGTVVPGDASECFLCGATL